MAQGSFLAKTGKGERQVGQIFCFSLAGIREDSTLLVKTTIDKSIKLLHLCSEVREQQYLQGRDLYDTAKHLLGYKLKLPSGWMLLFSSDGIRRLSFQNSTADHLLFGLLLVC